MRILKLRQVKKVVAKVLALSLLVTSCSVGGIMPSSVITSYAAAAWDASAIYVEGDEVEYEGAIYKAKWWTQGNTPTAGDPWELVSGGNTGGDIGDNPGGTTGSGSLEGEDASVELKRGTGTNIQGIPIPKNYYDRKVVGYFPNYAFASEAHQEFDIADLQWDKLTHIQYAFGVVNKETCKIEAGDVKNDIENTFPDHEFYHKGQKIELDPTLDYNGQFNIMHTLKKMYPDVTVLISTGGWGASEGLWYATQNESTMRTFCDSAVEFIRKYGFDGIDIDFEFPSETPLSGNYTDFTESIRPGIANRYSTFIKMLSESLAKASKEDGKYYWLTSAVSASSWVLGGQTNSDFLDYLDFVSIMSYDYHGGWNNYVENQANLYPDPADGETAIMDVKTLGFSWSEHFYRGKVQSEKILMGVPYYTRGWTNVQGGTNGLHGTSGTPLTNATDNLNLWYDEDANGQETPAGANPLWHVMNVMKENPDYKSYWDEVGKVPHIWNATNQTFLTFEDTQSVQERINYVKNNNLGGVLIWVMHGDYDYDEITGKYTVGDTLTTMFHDQFKEMGAAAITSDIDYTNKVLDFDVDCSAGKYDHPNYTYTIKVKNNSGVEIPAGFTFSFYLPTSSNFTSSWGGTSSVRKVNDTFNEVTLTSTTASLPSGGEVEFTGMMKCCFSAMKNFKINGLSMKSEVEEEITRLNRSYVTDSPEWPKPPTTEETTQDEGQDGTTEPPIQPPTEEPTEPSTEEATEKPTEKPTEPPTEEATEKPTEPPTEEVTEKPTEPPTGEVTEKPTEPPTGEITEKPTEPPTGEITEKPTEPPTGEVTEKPTEPPTGEVTEKPTEPPTGEITEKPTEPPTEEVTEKPTEPPTEEATEKPTEPPTEEATEKPTGGSTEKPAGRPTEEATEKPAGGSTEKPTEPPSQSTTETPKTEAGKQEGTTETNHTGGGNTSSTTEHNTGGIGSTEGNTGNTGGTEISNVSSLVGKIFNSGRLVYKITKATSDGGEVQVVKALKKSIKTLSIPTTVTYEGKLYKVVHIGNNAFKNSKFLKRVTIGKNVSSIGKKAFYGCKKLKRVKFKNNHLKTVGKKAFSKTGVGLRISTGNKKRVRAYKKLLKKKIPVWTIITK